MAEAVHYLSLGLYLRQFMIFAGALAALSIHLCELNRGHPLVVDLLNDFWPRIKKHFLPLGAELFHS